MYTFLSPNSDILAIHPSLTNSRISPPILGNSVLFCFVFNQERKYFVLSPPPLPCSEVSVFIHAGLTFSACLRCLCIKNKWLLLRCNFLSCPCVVIFPSLQSKDKICEKSIGTTQLSPQSTIAIQQTTTRFGVLTTTKGVTTSHLPTSLPTEGNQPLLESFNYNARSCFG